MRSVCSEQSTLNWNGQEQSYCSLQKQSIAMATRGVDTSRMRHTVCFQGLFVCVCVCVCSRGSSESVCLSVCARCSCVSVCVCSSGSVSR